MLLEAVLKLLSQNQSLVDVGARLRAIGRIIVGKRASTINGELWYIAQVPAHGQLAGLFEDTQRGEDVGSPANSSERLGKN